MHPERTAQRGTVPQGVSDCRWSASHSALRQDTMRNNCLGKMAGISLIHGMKEMCYPNETQTQDWKQIRKKGEQLQDTPAVISATAMPGREMLISIQA